MVTTTESLSFNSTDLRFVDAESRESKRVHIGFVESERDRLCQVSCDFAGKAMDYIGLIDTVIKI